MYERHAARIHRFCARRLDDQDDAADAVQDTFLRAWLALEDGVEVRHPIPWLLTIADNVCVSRFRARSARVSTTELSEGTGVDFSDTPSEVAGLATALRALPVRQRRALLRREVQGYSYDEIGAELGASRASVAALIHRARLAVADTLRDARRGVGALVPIPAILRAPFEGMTAGGAAVAGTTTVIAVAHLAGAGPPPPWAAAPPTRPAGALVAVAEPGRLAGPTTVHARTVGWPNLTLAATEVLGRRLRAAGTGSSAERAAYPELRAPLPESSWDEDLVDGAPTSAEPEPSPEADAPASGPEAGDPAQPAGPTTQSAESDSQEVATPPAESEKGARGRSASAPGRAGKASDNSGKAREDSGPPPHARGNGPPTRDDAPSGDPAAVDPAAEKPRGEPEPENGPAAQGNGGGEGSGKSQDKDDAGKAAEGEGEGSGPPSGPSL
jgi:RNA polymerase sigma-70 factor, ECF subfamily